MQTMRVYRVEDENGRGPFVHRLLQEINVAMTGDPDADWHVDFPGTLEAFGPQPLNHVCGTLTLRDLVRWVPRPMRRVLARHGYGLSVYAMPPHEVKHGRGDAMQVMFRAAEAVDADWRPFV